MLKKILIVLIFLITLSIASENIIEEFATGNNLFTAALYKEILKINEGNLIISPFSLQSILAFTCFGAKGETANEIENSLLLPNKKDKLELFFNTFVPKLQGNGQSYGIEWANKIYVENNATIKDDFRIKATRIFKSEVENIDFSLKTKASHKINEWVNNKTNKKIQHLIDPNNLDAQTKIILINALYLNAKWKYPFPLYSTTEENFHKSLKETVKVNMMHTTNFYNYYESEELKAKFLELPYTYEDIRMVIVLPNEIEGLSHLEHQLENVINAPVFQMERVSVSIPRFSIENKLNLVDILKNLGIKKAFNNEADLSGILEGHSELFISNVIQKAFINVTEDGTEAAAASAVISSDSLPVPSDILFEANYQFLFFIKFKSVILFIGKYC